LISEKLDKVPRKYRPLGAGLAAPLVARLLHLSPPAAVVNSAAIAAGLGAGLVITFRFLRRPRREDSKFEVKALEVEVGGSAEERAQGARQIEEVLKQRAKAGKVRYLVLSALQGGFSRTIVGVGGDPKDVGVEFEVVKTLMAMNLKNLRLRDVDAGTLEVVSRVLSAVVPSSRAEPLFITPETGLVTVERPGGIYLGTAYEGAYPKPTYLTEDDVKGHVAIFGSTGTGKTTTLTLLALRASSAGFRVIAFDWAGEVQKALNRLGVDRELLVIDPTRDGGVNPFAEEGLANRPELLVDMLSDALDLTQPQAYLLLRVIEDRGLPSDFNELERAVEAYPEEARWDRDVKRGLLRKIAVLTSGESRRLFSGSVSLDEVESHDKVVAIDRIESPSVRRAYSLVLLSALFTKRDRAEPLLVAIDEAHNLMGNENDIVGRIMAEARKYRLHVALATQSPSSIPNSVLLNANTKIVHALRSSRDKEIISQSMNLHYALLEELDKLGPGEAIVQSPSLSRPVLVKVELGSPARHGNGYLVKGKPVQLNAAVPPHKLFKEDVQGLVNLNP